MHDTIAGGETVENKASGTAGKGGFLPAWGWGEAMVATGCVSCIVSAAALPWARTDVTWKSLLFGNDIELGKFTFKLTDNPWLTVALISLAALCLAGLLWRRRAGDVAIAASLLLIMGSAVYVICLVEDAYDFLGLYERLLELVNNLPMIGPVVESVVRENLSINAFPHAGVYVFFLATLLILCGGLLIKRRSRIHV